MPHKTIPRLGKRHVRPLVVNGAPEQIDSTALK
jgi:hypothetical protein